MAWTTVRSMHLAVGCVVFGVACGESATFGTGTSTQELGETLIRVTDFSEDSHCSGAGSRVDAGVDDGGGEGVAADGVLQDGEVDSTTYICTGSTGPAGEDGYSSLLRISPEAVGSRCGVAGFRIDSGLDNGDGGGSASDGVLQDGEIDGTEYMCEPPHPRGALLAFQNGTWTGNVLSVDTASMTATSIHDVDDDFVQYVQARGGAIAYRHYAADDYTTVHYNGNYYDLNALWGGDAYFTAVFGSKVVFVGAHGGPWNVMVGDYVDGSFTQITENEELGTGYYEVDTDGEWAVYRRYAGGSNTIVAYNLVTGESRDVGSGSSPHVGAGHISYIGGDEDVMVYDIATASTVNITADIAAASESSIDANVLAFTASGALFVYDLGSSERSLVEGASTNRARAVGSSVLFVTADHHMARVYDTTTGSMVTVASDAEAHFDFRPLD